MMSAEGKKKNFSSKLIIILLLVSLLLSLWNLQANYRLGQELERTKQAIADLRKGVVSDSQRPQGLSEPTTRPLSHQLTKSIAIAAVSKQGDGVIGNLTLRLIPGNNNVLVNTDPFLEADIQQATNRAVAVAKTRSNYNYDKDFIFKFRMGDAQLVGGPSAGAATTIVALAALQNESIRQDTAITGSINSDGSIGRVGGLLEKIEAAADAGYQQFLLPETQIEFTYYEKKVTRESSGLGFEFLSREYVPKTVNLKKMAQEKWGITVKGVANIKEAEKYLFTSGKD